MSGGARKKFQMTNLIMPSYFSFMMYALKSVPALADVGVPPMGIRMAQNSTQMSEGSRKKFQITNLSMPNEISKGEISEISKSCMK